MGDIMSGNFRWSWRLRLRQRSGGLNDYVVICVNDIALWQLLSLVHMRRQWCISDILVSLIVVARLTNHFVNSLQVLRGT